MVNSHQNGEADMVFQLAGFPVKKVNVRVLKDFKVIPGGQSIGVKLNTKGVLVVGHHLIQTEKGKVSPGETAGVQIGDMITEINGKTIERMSDVAPFIHNSGETGEPLNLVLLRDGKHIRTKLTPQKTVENRLIALVYIFVIRAGIGTMTFVHPDSMKYGALGHVISDNDTKSRFKSKMDKLCVRQLHQLKEVVMGIQGEISEVLT